MVSCTTCESEISYIDTSLIESSYGMPFLEHSYKYHFTRIDHRHNFSVYNTLLHLNSAYGSKSSFRIESLAFVPQLFLSVGAIPYTLAKKDLASTMLAQTFAFVTFNKVCTSQVSKHTTSGFDFPLIGYSTSYGIWCSFPYTFHLPRCCVSHGSV